jgi:hypothetical protein
MAGMRLKTVLLALLLVSIMLGLLSIPPKQAAATSSANSDWVRNAIETITCCQWDPQYQAFRTSPYGETFNYWTDDHGKLLDLFALNLTGSYSGIPADTWANRIRDFIYTHTLSGGYLLRKVTNIQPKIVNAGPLNFTVHDYMIQLSGNLSKSRDRSLQVTYWAKNQPMVYIQGQVLTYNETEKDLSYNSTWTLTGYSIIDGTGAAEPYVTLEQVWDKTDFTLIIDYTLLAHRPELQVTYTLRAKAGLSNVLVSVPLDLLDDIGPVPASGKPLSYAWVWIPGYADQRAVDNYTAPENFLTDKSKWNQTWFMIHMHNQPDAPSTSHAIIADWGEYKPLLIGIDNQLDPNFAFRHLPNSLHYVRQNVSLGFMQAGRSQKWTVKYYFLDNHDWTNLAPVYQELFAGRDLSDLDLSMDYEYGTVVYGLAKLYAVRHDIDDWNLALRLHRYWYFMFNRANNGTYIRDLGFMLRATVLLLQAGNSGLPWYAYLQSTLSFVLNKLLYVQNLTPSDKNYGGFREWFYYNSTEQKQYFGWTYLDYLASGLMGLEAYYDYMPNSTVLERINIAKNTMFVTADGSIGIYSDADGIAIDEDTGTTFKSAMLAEAFSHPLALGVSNSTYTLRAVNHVWWRSSLNSTRSVVYIGDDKFETNTETQPWGFVGWYTWVTRTAASNPFSVQFIQSNNHANMTDWALVDDQFNLTVQAKNEIVTVSLPSDRAPAGFYSSNLQTWSWDNVKSLVTVSYPSDGAASVLTAIYPQTWRINYSGTYLRITWNSTSGSYTFKGIYPNFPQQRLVVQNSTTAFSLDRSSGIYWVVTANSTRTAAETIYLDYGAPLGWIFSSVPMPTASIMSPSIYGNFSISANQSFTVKVDTGSFLHGPRLVQIKNGFNPAGNGTYSAGEYSLQVKGRPNFLFVEVTVTFEQGLGTGTTVIVILGSVGALAGAGVVVVARGRIKNWLSQSKT